MASDLWANVYKYNTDNVRKALYGSILIRDRIPGSSDLSAFTPFGADGLFLTTLQVQHGGSWYNLGAGQSDGPKFSRNLDIERTPIWQSRLPARSDVTEDQGSIMFGLAEQTDISDNLEFDLPLSGDTFGQGQPGYQKTQPNETEARERQLLALGVDKKGHYFADLFPRVSFSKLDDTEWNPKNPVVMAITWDYFICTESGFPRRRFREGAGWRATSDDAS